MVYLVKPSEAIPAAIQYKINSSHSNNEANQHLDRAVLGKGHCLGTMGAAGIGSDIFAA